MKPPPTRFAYQFLIIGPHVVGRHSAVYFSVLIDVYLRFCLADYIDSLVEVVHIGHLKQAMAPWTPDTLVYHLSVQIKVMCTLRAFS